jgi:hypothetical protein
MCAIDNNDVAEGSYKVSDVCARYIKHARDIFAGIKAS